MSTVKQKLKYIIAAIVAMILLFIATLACNVNALAFADTESGSPVLDDLCKDENFDLDNYPIKNDDYSLEVIQIAESTDGELLIYVYQPSGLAANIFASKISIALEADNDKGLTPVLYNLKYISSTGALFMYKVKNFTVSSDPVRYYNLIMIQRKAIDGVDIVAEGNKLEYKAYRVGQYWKVEDTEDGLYYSLTNSKVVEIINPFASYIRVERHDGTQNHTYYQDNHYIAFSTDWDIDNLVSATVSFTLFDYYTRPGIGFNRYNDKPQEKDIYCDEVNSFKQSDYVVFTWFGFVLNDPNKSYSWERIQSSAEFCEKSGANSSDIEEVRKCQWVLMFEETHSLFNQDYTSALVDTYEEAGQGVDEVTVLRLEFISDGVCYNLGTVSDTVSKDYGYNGGGSAAANKGLPEWAMLLIAGAVGAVAGLVVGVIVCKKRGD